MLHRRRGVRAKRFPLRVFKCAKYAPVLSRAPASAVLHEAIARFFPTCSRPSVTDGLLLWTGPTASAGGSPYCTVSFLDAAVVFFGSSSVSTPSAYFATALASSTS